MSLLPPLEKDQVSEITKKVYEQFEETTGKVPEWVKVMAYKPEILKEFVELFEVIMKKKSKPAMRSETVIR